MNDTMSINRAKVIAKLAHKGQKYGTADYFQFHVKSVVRRVLGIPHCTDQAVIIAYLHDVIEDTGVTDTELGYLGVPIQIINCVEVISRRAGEQYLTYILRVLDEGTADTILVKYCDLQENIYNCRSVIRSCADSVTKARSKNLLERYENAMVIVNHNGPAGISDWA